MSLRHPQHVQSAPEAIGLSPQALRELAGFIVGEKLGEGAYRTVYAHRLDPDLVVKVEQNCSGRFCNIDEWNLWNEVMHSKEIAPWFAPVRAISSCGQFLIQERTAPLARMPRRVPHFMADLKLENMGRLRGRPVFHDYANTKIETLALRRLKLVDAS